MTREEPVLCGIEIGAPRTLATVIASKGKGELGHCIHIYFHLNTAKLELMD